MRHSARPSPQPAQGRRPDRRGELKPLVAVFNSRNDIIPGHNNLDKICEAVKAGIYMAGGVPFEISTIGVCDGIAMNHDGMHYSLVSREAIADSFECAVQGHAFDAAVCIPNCDKIVPGMLLGALRVNIPTGDPRQSHAPGHQPGCSQGATTDLNTLFDGAARCRRHHDRRGAQVLRGHRVSQLRFLLRHVHRQLHELPVRGSGHRASRQRHHPRRVLRAPAFRRHAGMKVRSFWRRGICIKGHHHRGRHP